MKCLFTIVACLMLNLSQAQVGIENYQNATTALKNNDHQKAYDEIINAIKLNNEEPKYYVFLINLLVINNQHQDALSVTKSAVHKFPQNFDIHYEAGYCFVECGLSETAAKHFIKADSLTTDDSLKLEAKKGLATAYIYTEGKQVEAYQLMKQYLATYPDDLVCLGNVGILCYEIGKGDEGKEHLEHALRINPTYAPALVNLGFAAQNQGNHQEAIDYFTKVITTSPDEAFAYSNRSYSKLQLGDKKGAMEDIEKSIALRPSNSWAYRNRALIHLSNQKNKKACEDLKTALEKGFTKMYGSEVSTMYKKYCIE